MSKTALFRIVKVKSGTFRTVSEHLSSEIIDLLEKSQLDEKYGEKYTLTKEGCVTDTEKKVIKQLRDRNYKYAMNKPGLWERIRKKWNVYVPQKFQSILGCASTVLLEDPEYENFIGVVSILKGTYFEKDDCADTFSLDFSLLLHISEYSGKTMEKYNVMVIEMGKNSDAVSDNDYSSDSKTQLHLSFQKKIYLILEIIVLS